MKKGIIHISDLHVCEHLDDDGNIINSSWFTRHEIPFGEDIITFIKKKKKILGIEDFYLIVSGDLSNTSSTIEYIHTKAILAKLHLGLKISLKNILIIPGNHDINWFENKKAFEESKTAGHPKKSWEFNIQKFGFFKSFYDDFYSTIDINFNPENNIVHIIPIEEIKVLLIGLNSILFSSYIAKEYGDFELEKLDNELGQALTAYPDYTNIAIFHHNPKINIKEGQESLKDWAEKKVIFNKHNINTFFFGHEHTYGATKDENDFCNYFATGSLGIKSSEVNNYLNIIEVIESENNISLKANFFKLERERKPQHPEWGFWNNLNDPSCEKPILIVERPIVEDTSIVEPLLPKISLQSKTEKKQNSALVPNTIDYSNANLLVGFVKEKRLYKSGHFHWSDDAKSHNWIDTPNLLSSREVSTFCQKAIIEIVNNGKLTSDLIIGIGMEGCFLGSSVAIQLDQSFTFVPYEYRYKDHDTYETKLNHSTVKNVTIITDVVHSGNTIKRLLEYEKAFFNDTETINVISLFYTGSGKKNYDIDLLNEINSKLKFYTVCDKLRVETCPYGNDFEDKCQIYSKKIENVYEFYSKNKVKS
jgi:3',5'-cyclic AMP phosphodiesterase CpdA/adenine/guanine phosphoribosyltransferase-like PRPP-binding protein